MEEEARPTMPSKSLNRDSESPMVDHSRSAEKQEASAFVALRKGGVWSQSAGVNLRHRPILRAVARGTRGEQ
jgi:hypothetical protein